MEFAVFVLTHVEPPSAGRRSNSPGPPEGHTPSQTYRKCILTCSLNSSSLVQTSMSLCQSRFLGRSCLHLFRKSGNKLLLDKDLCSSTSRSESIPPSHHKAKAKDKHMRAETFDSPYTRCSKFTFTLFQTVQYFLLEYRWELSVSIPHAQSDLVFCLDFFLVI